MPTDTSLDSLADRELAAHIAALRSQPTVLGRQLGAVALRERRRGDIQARPAGPPVGEVTNLEIVADPAQPGTSPIPARHYRSSLSGRPLVVYMHGGGWTIGDLDSHDRLCRRLCVEAQVSVLSVGYRLAPEHPFPAALEDTLAAFRWAYSHRQELAGTSLVPAVAGDSAGGHLAALACLYLRDSGDVSPSAQILLYPNTDLTFRLPSVAEKATGWMLEADNAIWFAEQWVPDPEMRGLGSVSPLYAQDLRSLPPALLITAEHDPLRDEGDAYAQRLAQAGVTVTHRCELGLVHGFAGLDYLFMTAEEAVSRWFGDVRRLFFERT